MDDDCPIYTERREALEDVDFNEFKYLSLTKQESVYIESVDELTKIMEGYCDQGYEGILVKAPHGIYELKRSKYWQKFKPTISITLPIIEYVEGDGKYKNHLGAFTLRGEDGGKFYELSLGIGFNDEERKEFWNNKNALIGRLVEVYGDSATQSSNNPHVWSLRFPRFKGFRGHETTGKV